MNREKYKAAFDQLPFSPDFQARTQALLRTASGKLKRRLQR